jgi:hypothetical protein
VDGEGHETIQQEGAASDLETGEGTRVFWRRATRGLGEIFAHAGAVAAGQTMDEAGKFASEKAPEPLDSGAFAGKTGDGLIPGL